MSLFYLFLFISATLSVPIFFVNFRKASPDQRRKMVYAAIGAVSVAAITLLLLQFR
jgi:hypothetical protein